MSSFQFRVAFAAAALTAALVMPVLPSAAHAGDPDDDSATVRVHVSIPHVDFDDPSQVGAVYRRLRTEANYVCQVAATYAQNDDTRAERTCETNAVAGAVRDINQPQLSRLDDQRTHNGRTDKTQIELSLNSPHH